MGQGLQIYNAVGQLVLDTSSRPMKLLSSANLTVGVPQSVPISIPPGVTVNVGVTIEAPEASASTNNQPNFNVTSNQVEFTWQPDSGFGSVRADIFLF